MSRNARGEGSIYRRKDGRWEGAVFVTTSSGRRRRVRIYGRTRSEVHTKLVERVRQEQQGIVSPDRTWRLGDFLDYWLPIVKNTRRPTTYTSYEMIIRLYLKPALGHYPLSRLTVAIVQQALTERLAEGRSVRTVQKMRTVLSAALTRAQREELVVRNVAHHIELPTWHRKNITPWTLEQARTFLTAARSHRWQPAFLLLVVYGMRRSEALGLRWQDIDFDRRVIHVRNQILRHDGDWHLGPVKTNAGERDLPLLPLISGALRSLYEPGARPDQLVFQTQFGTPIDGGNLLRAFARISEQAGLPRITLHHLRHTAATFLKNLGLPARDTQLILGHAHISTTQQLYQHADVAGQTTALSKLQSAIVVESDGSNCRQELPSDTENGPKVGPSTLGFSLVAPTGLEPVTQGSSGRSDAPSHPHSTEVAASEQGSSSAGVAGLVAVSSAVNTHGAHRQPSIEMIALDTLLKRCAQAPLLTSGASVDRHLRTRTNTYTLGVVAVTNGCQRTRPGDTVGGLALAVEFELRDALRRLQLQQLTRAGFPYNLIQREPRPELPKLVERRDF